MFGIRLEVALKALSTIAVALLAISECRIGGGFVSGRPNILVIFGDDVGYANISLYNPGVMGYTTPNIDRIGREGVMFSDHYAQPSCTAGRAAFITGQYPIRSGLTTVGTPGSKAGSAAGNAHLGRSAEGAGLCDRPVRQESPGRP